LAWLGGGFRHRRGARVRALHTLGAGLYVHGADNAEAYERGLRLLKANLTPAQRQQFDTYRYFEVIGGKTGRRYRIRHGCSMNIEQIDRKGRRVCGWCFFPKGRLVPGDVMLAQKLALELFEPEALKLANNFF
jgi:hypothetical protein